MTDIEMEKRLRQLRQGFDIAIERTLREKAGHGRPVVVAEPNGTPSLLDARTALTDFLKNKNKKVKQAR